MNFKKLLKKITPNFLLDWYHYAWALAGAVFYGFPSRKLTVIGVTGTSGKSTTVDFITRILEEAHSTSSRQAINKVVSNSSIRFKVGQKEWRNEVKMGMPGRFFMHKLLSQGVKAGCNYAVLEVTSEGIKQHRHRFINFDTAVFTNLTPEHIESHGSFENYRNEKLKLFTATANIHVINADDENAKYFIAIPAKKVITFGMQRAAEVKAEQVMFADGISFFVGGVEIHLNLIGKFNVYNALAAITVARAYGVSLEICKKALAKATGIPGRMEIVAQKPLVVVDYAHTPEQLKQAYESLQPKPLVCVLGSCGGGRDKWKRPVLGNIAARYCKEIIVTNEDPYDEDPIDIINQVAAEAGGNVQKIVDRKEAIQKAIQLAKPEDAVIITGKGSESVMCLEHGKRIAWDDRQIARDVAR